MNNYCSTDSYVLPTETKASDTQVAGNHYKLPFCQPAEFITKNNIGYIEGNVIKYVCRHATKNGKQDLEKAIHYLQLLMEWKYPPVEDDFGREDYPIYEN